MSCAQAALLKSLRLLVLQKSGINAKNDNVKVLGIRVREVMHERRIELLERSAVLPGGPLLPIRPPPSHNTPATLAAVSQSPCYHHIAEAGPGSVGKWR